MRSFTAIVQGWVADKRRRGGAGSQAVPSPHLVELLWSL